MEIYAVKVIDINDEWIENLCCLFDFDKKNKIRRIINKKDKIRTLVGEILIRTIIIEKIKIGNKFIKFNKNQFGKTYLKDYPNLNFNISHSGEYALSVIDNKSIGILSLILSSLLWFSSREFIYILIIRCAIF